MKETLRRLTSQAPDGPQARNLVREYLQARILQGLQRRGAMIPLAFQGGTALRFLYDLPRFSEDLDFALERRDRGAFDLPRITKRLASEFSKEGYEIDFKVGTDRVVHSSLIRFPGLYHELGLSGHRAETLAVRIDVDTNPPEGAVLVTTLVRRHVVLNLQHHDRGSLLAGKLHAVLQRPYAKGRDYFDLFWYLSAPDWPEPNLTLLNNALRQTRWEGDPIRRDAWREVLHNRVEGASWARLLQDVEPFLEAPLDAALFTRENLLSLLR